MHEAMNVDLHIRHTIHLDDDSAGIVAQCLSLLTAINERTTQMAIDLQPLKDEITELKSVNAGVKALLADLKARLDALADVGDVVQLKAELRAMRDSLDEETNGLAAAVEANTPAG